MVKNSRKLPGHTFLQEILVAAVVERHRSLLAGRFDGARHVVRAGLGVGPRLQVLNCLLQSLDNFFEKFGLGVDPEFLDLIDFVFDVLFSLLVLPFVGTVPCLFENTCRLDSVIVFDHLLVFFDGTTDVLVGVENDDVQRRLEVDGLVAVSALHLTPSDGKCGILLIVLEVPLVGRQFKFDHVIFLHALINLQKFG